MILKAKISYFGTKVAFFARNIYYNANKKLE